MVPPWCNIRASAGNDAVASCDRVVKYDFGTPQNRVPAINLRCLGGKQVLLHGKINRYCLGRIQVDQHFDTVFGLSYFEPAKVTFSLQGIGPGLFTGDGVHETAFKLSTRSMFAAIFCIAYTLVSMCTFQI